jgi:transposase InsO family protein
VGISRQGFYQYEQKRDTFVVITQQVIDYAKQTRENHPRMGARNIYLKMSAEPACQDWFSQIGRDKVESILLNNGFRIKKVRAYYKTTIRGFFVFDNLIKGLTINRIDQVWVSDITYFFVVEAGKVTHYYLTFIMDLHSRHVLGYAVSMNLTTEATTLPALEMALKTRNTTTQNQLETLILHSDGGGQFADKNFVAKLRFFGIQSSMGKEAYENPNAERLNGTIKNDYLIPWHVESFSLLKLLTAKAVKLYNTDRPHSALKGLSPVQFEKLLK